MPRQLEDEKHFYNLLLTVKEGLLNAEWVACHQRAFNLQFHDSQGHWHPVSFGFSYYWGVVIVVKLFFCDHEHFPHGQWLV